MNEAKWTPLCFENHGFETNRVKDQEAKVKSIEVNLFVTNQSAESAKVGSG